MIYHGLRAVRRVEEDEDITLTPEMFRTVMCEGYSDTVYLDSKGIETNKVGQTGVWLHRSFVEAFNHHEERVIKRLPNYRTYPSFLRAELMQAEYRGDLGLSPKAMQLLRDDRWVASAEEFLDNAEYQNPNTPRGIRKRMEAVYFAIRLYGSQK